MKSFDLKPTKKNLIEMLEKDSLGRNRAIYRFIGLLLSIEDATTISIDGDWGSGKTFFVKQLQLVLEAYNPNSKISENKNDIKQIKNSMPIVHKPFFDDILDKNPQVVVYYDAWENDDEVDPVLSLIFRIVESIDKNFNIEIELPDMIKKLLEILVKNPKIIDKIPVLKNINLIFSFIKDCKSMIKFNSVLKNQKQNNDLKQEIKVFLNSLLTKEKSKLIILIDELDRCSPSYAVKMLERIKHYFDDKRIIFVFSTDLSQLTHTIKKFYGEGYDSCRYLNRFFDLRLKLPEVDLEKYCEYLDFYDDSYFIKISARQVIKKYKLSLRQINRFYKLLKISTFNILEKKFTMEIYVSFINPIAIALSIIDINKYNDFISGNNSIPLIDLLEYLYNGKYKNEIKKKFFTQEEFSSMNDTSIYLKLQEIFEKIYKAVFVENYIENDMFNFNHKTKELIQNSLNLLSDLSYFEEQEENIAF